MTDILFGIYGAGGHGREILPFAIAQLEKSNVSLDRLCFIDDATPERLINDVAVLTLTEFLSMDAAEKRVAVTMGNSAARQAATSRIAAHGITPWSVTAATAVVLSHSQIGQGAVLSSFVYVGPNVRIGTGFQANTRSHVSHDCVIEDFVTLAPGAICNGNVHVRAHAYIGAGALIRQGAAGRPLVIGAHAVVGMGAVVIDDVPPLATVVGNPARILEKRSTQP
ncbi:acetyltransferase [Pigmentiphaga litoralis]|uniref:Sugar O-acyltransferase (Sialic acid O-acetyltransferase NeuD family) n=1 Tax=Pigmentiphaga litoralis TaxID=516702 RepID=A0A7Y9ISJ1_9BURK|nr:acetyltransferase [Pigmentiphaga litoralis]NYE24194.1 sugar O-acyltransferase (sialic acid O-acetyltransferase NeuD family) [Pigmentiphaga litoralis]NYE82192.1 sugar O-acyltransferase (sialic acid O-acetyltransferase NeuD family) [Pigmentiphaga litoralis]